MPVNLGVYRALAYIDQGPESPHFQATEGPAPQPHGGLDDNKSVRALPRGHTAIAFRDRRTARPAPAG
jgi:hypothetical protein